MQVQRDGEIAAGRWLGVGVAAAPAIEVADQGGLLTALASPGAFEIGELASPLLMVGLFGAIGGAAAWLLRRHGRAGRLAFVAACAVPVTVWILYTGLRLVAVVPALAFPLCLGHLRR